MPHTTSTLRTCALLLPLILCAAPPAALAQKPAAKAAKAAQPAPYREPLVAATFPCH